VAHCRKEDLADLDRLIESIRGIDGLSEKSFGCFYLKGKGVLHFHRVKERRFIHLWNGRDWKEIDLSDQPSTRTQSSYFKKIYAELPLSPSVKK
jgi:hypothetical protein